MGRAKQSSEALKCFLVAHDQPCFFFMAGFSSLQFAPRPPLQFGLLLLKKIKVLAGPASLARIDIPHSLHLVAFLRTAPSSRFPPPSGLLEIGEGGQTKPLLAWSGRLVGAHWDGDGAVLHTKKVNTTSPLKRLEASRYYRCSVFSGSYPWPAIGSARRASRSQPHSTTTIFCASASPFP